MDSVAVKEPEGDLKASTEIRTYKYDSHVKPIQGENKSKVILWM